jgi:hypothetical protein
MTSNDNVINSELEGMWKETFVDYFEILSGNLPEWIEEYHYEP